MASSPRWPSKPRQKSRKGDRVTGSKWVGNNWEALAEATQSNGGQLPYSISLVTSYFPNKEVWSDENLPLILFYLIPPASVYNGQDIVTKIRDDGKRLRSFDILPDRLSVDVKGWLLEAWRRLDPRISYEDIIDRMSPDPDFCHGKGLAIPTKNSLQMHTLRSCRKLLGYWQLESLKEEPSRAMVEALERLTPYNLFFNTVLPLCDIDSNRLVKLKFVRKSDDGPFKAVPLAVTPDNIRDTTLPVHFFLRHMQNHDNPLAFSTSVDRAWETLLMLQERADIHGFSHWSKLHKNCRPVSWQTRTKGAIPSNRPDDDKDGDDRMKAHTDTYDGGCSICTWRPGSELAHAAADGSPLKRIRADGDDEHDDEHDDDRVARRTRTEAYESELISSDTGLTSEAAYSSPSAYTSMPGEHRRYLPTPSTPMRHGDNTRAHVFNSSPPSYCGTFAPQASQPAMTPGPRLRPMLPPLAGLPRSKSDSVNIGPGPTIMHQHQAHVSNGNAHNGFAHPTPPLLGSLTEPSHHTTVAPGEAPTVSAKISTDPGSEQKRGAHGHLWQPLTTVQNRTVDLQNALGNPFGHQYQQQIPSGRSNQPANYRCNEHVVPRAPTPVLVPSNKRVPREPSPHPEALPCQDPVFTDPATPQYIYAPRLSAGVLSAGVLSAGVLSAGGQATFFDSSQEPKPNLDWDDAVFGMLIHSDEANVADPEVAKAYSSLPDGAAVSELKSQLPIHSAKHYGVDAAKYQQLSSANDDFLDQPQAE